jgi:hypothetical protein
MKIECNGYDNIIYHAFFSKGNLNEKEKTVDIVSPTGLY